MTLGVTVRAWVAATRPVHPGRGALLARCWAELPELGRLLPLTAVGSGAGQ